MGTLLAAQALATVSARDMSRRVAAAAAAGTSLSQMPRLTSSLAVQASATVSAHGTSRRAAATTAVSLAEAPSLAQAQSLSMRCRTVPCSQTAPPRVPMRVASREPATTSLAIFSRALAIMMALGLAQSLTASVREFTRVALVELTRSPSAQALADVHVGIWNVATGLAWLNLQRTAPSTCLCNRVRAGSCLVVKTSSQRLRGLQTLGARVCG